VESSYFLNFDKDIMNNYFSGSYYNKKDLSKTLSSLESNLEIVLSKGSPQEDVLLIMKTLLEDIKIRTSINEYIEEEPYESTMDIYRRENIDR
jgi:hypothetical protein